ncbi:MAG: crotonase/enoyl-CoA hydratase family protein [Alphaproteobacteria bacterium]|nr:crotonase/enoyl-CoA hydratase family protein [Alphaproteobacteria bacterium]MDE2011879.1 crotonase/enoyl-CoA hydratase family protein [Alphaproteobacteria bacterium]MDE2073679.1 crotonase/enoyl-CoA hydratase family protein [Alphaproteobacteria bacterium]
MTYRCFNLEIAQGIAHLQLKRAEELNSMVPEFWHELPAIVRDIDDHARARVIVISSTGKHFSAGMDLSVFTSGQSAGTAAAASSEERGRVRANLRLTVQHLQETFSVLERARLPVLAAIQGGCVGGAVDFATACDCRYMTEDGFFVIQEINLGMTADVGTFPRLCHLMPEGMVRELAYSGRRLPAAKALQLGLVNEVFPTQEAMLAHVMGLAKDIAEKSPLAVHGSKVMINYARDHSVADALDYIATWQAGMYNPETDMKESFIAKVEKRAPQFADLLPVRKGLDEV